MQNLIATALPLGLTVLGASWLVALAVRLWRVRPDGDASPRISRTQLVSELLVALLLLVLLRGSAAGPLLQLGWLVYLVLAAAVVWLGVHRWPVLPATGRRPRAVTGNG